MNSAVRQSGDRGSAQPAGDHDIRNAWLIGPDQALPEGLIPETIIEFNGLRADPDSLPEILYIPLSPEKAGRNLRQIRALCGEAVYLVAVLPKRLGIGWAARLIGLGADDVVLPGDDVDFTLSLKRAERVVRARQATAERIAALKCQVEYLQACVDNLPSPIFFKDRDGIYVDCNRAFESFIGLSSQEVIGASVYDVAPDNLARTYEEADAALMAAGGTQVYEARVRSADGIIHDVAFHKAVTYGADGKVNGIAGAMLDITERKLLEEQLRDAAGRDPMTNAFNRRSFFERARLAEAQASVTGAPLCLIAIDIDNFKAVNDAFGHSGGDAVLCHTVDILDGFFGEPNVFARIGGEEFLGLFAGRTVEEIVSLADEIRLALSRSPLLHEGRKIDFTASFGVAALDLGTETIEAAVKRADKALYKAKGRGRNRVIAAAG